MEVISWNSRDTGDHSKRNNIEEIHSTLQPWYGVNSQDKDCCFWLKIHQIIWSSNEVGWIYVDSIGRSGGLLILWDDVKIKVLNLLEEATLSLIYLFIKTTFIEKKM